MSATAAGVDAASQAEAKLHATLRFAVGVTAAFVGCEYVQWNPTFLAPVLTAALLANLPMRPPMKLALVLVLSMVGAATFAFASASLLRGTPTILFGLLALAVFVSFHAMISGRPALPFMLLLICLATIPVVVMVAPAQAGLFPKAMVRGIVVAIAMIWLVYVPWPRVPARPPAPDARSGHETPLALALLSTAVVVPLILVYLLFGLTDVFPVMLGTVMLVVNFDLARSRSQALGMIFGNFGGGLLALLLHSLLLTMPNLLTLAILLFLPLLWLGQRIVAGGPSAGVAVIACNAMLIILGTAIASGSGSLSLWLARLFHFALAGAFAVGMMSLIRYPAFQQRASAPTPAAR